MDTQEFNKEAKAIDTRTYHKRATNKWANLKIEIQDFQQTSIRSWNDAIFYLLKSGLEHEAKKAEQAKNVI